MSVRTDVVLVHPHLGGGGAERSTIDLVTALAGIGVRAEIVVARRTGDLLDQVPPSVPVTDLGGSGQHTLLRDARRLAARIRAVEPRALVGRLWYGVSLATLAHRMVPSPPMLAHVEDSVPTLYRPYVRFGGAKLRVHAAALRRAGKVLAVSPLVAGDVQSLGVRADNCVVVPNPVDVARVRALARHGARRTRPARPTVVQLGSLRPRKGADRLVDAVRGIDADLVFVGDGEERHALAARAERAGVAGRVAFTGFMENPYAEVQAATVLVQASRTPEAFGIACAEALALGVPVVKPQAQSPLLSFESRMERSFDSAPDDLARVLRDALDDGPTDDERHAAAVDVERYRPEAVAVRFAEVLGL